MGSMRDRESGSQKEKGKGRSSIFFCPLSLSLCPPFSLTVVFVLLAALLAARCDDLAEPVAITPEALRPTIITDLSATVNEDGSLTLDVEAEDRKSVV